MRLPSHRALAVLAGGMIGGGLLGWALLPEPPAPEHLVERPAPASTAPAPDSTAPAPTAVADSSVGTAPRGTPPGSRTAPSPRSQRTSPAGRSPDRPASRPPMGLGQDAASVDEPVAFEELPERLQPEAIQQVTDDLRTWAAENLPDDVIVEIGDPDCSSAPCFVSVSMPPVPGGRDYGDVMGLLLEQGGSLADAQRPLVLPAEPGTGPGLRITWLPDDDPGLAARIRHQNRPAPPDDEPPED